MSRDGLSAYARSIIADGKNGDPDGYYPTPPGATWALLAQEEFKGPIWEPACGEGHMSKVLQAGGYDVFSSDLFDRGYGTPGINFLECDTDFKGDIVTNPPFRLALQFAERGVSLAFPAGRKVALLCRLMWLETEKRAEFFRKYLSRVYVFSNRVPFQKGRLPKKGEGGRMVPYAWYVFDPAHTGAPTVHFIPYTDVA